MDPRTRRTLAVLGVAAGLWVLAAVALRTRDDAGPGGAPDDGAGPAATSGPRPLEERGLAGARAAVAPSRSDAGERDDARTTPRASDAARDGARVRGRVTGLASVPADAWASVEGPGRAGASTYLARTPIASDGSFVADAVAPAAEPPWTLRVRADVPGVAVRPADVEASRGATVEVELPVSTAAGTLRARVVDASNRAVPGLAVLVVRSGAQPFQHAELPRREVGLAVGARDADVAARGTTDADGRFAVGGLEPTAYLFAAADDRTWLEVEGGSWVVPREDELLVHARSAFVVRVAAVLPAGTPDGVWDGATFELAAVGPGPTMSVGTSERRTLFRGALADGGDGARELRLTVDASGFMADVRTLRVDRATPTHDVAAELVPLDPAVFGALVLASALRGADGRAFVPRMLEWRSSGRSRNGRWVRDEARADGRRTFRLPEGRRSIEVRAPDGMPFGDLLTWKADVEVARGAELERPFPAVPTGALRVRLPKDDGSGWVSASAVGDRATSVWTGTCPTRELYVPALPVGAWRLSLTVRPPSGGAVGARYAAEVRVLADDEVVVDVHEER